MRLLRRRAPAEVPAAEPQLLGIVRRRVRIRFGLTTEAFAERVSEVARAAGASAVDHALRLELDDLYLATACASGDEDAWAECSANHFGFIRSFAHRFLPDLAARDLADQVIADLWQRGKIARYSGRSTLRTWLGAVVTHAALNARKSQSSTMTDDRASDHTIRRGSTPLDTRGPEDADAQRTLSNVLARAIAELPAEDKLLLQLHYEQGLTLDEMERPMRTSKATLSRRLKRTRERLKETVDRLAQEMYGTSGAALQQQLGFDRLELDLSALLGEPPPVEENGREGV